MSPSRSRKRSRRNWAAGFEGSQHRPFLERLEDRQLLSSGLTDAGVTTLQPAVISSGTNSGQLSTGVLPSLGQSTPSSSGSTVENPPALPTYHHPQPTVYPGSEPSQPSVQQPQPTASGGLTQPTVVHPAVPPPTPQLTPPTGTPTPAATSTGSSADPAVPVVHHPVSSPKPPTPVNVVSTAKLQPAQPIPGNSNATSSAENETAAALDLSQSAGYHPSVAGQSSQQSSEEPESAQGAAAKNGASGTRGGTSTEQATDMVRPLALVSLAKTSGQGVVNGGAAESVSPTIKDAGNRTDSANPNAAASPSRGDLFPLIRVQEAQPTEAMVERAGLSARQATAGDGAGRLGAELLGGAVLLGEHLGQALWPASRGDYALAAGGVLTQEVNVSGNSTTAQTVNDQGAELGFLIGWALALPPGRMKHDATIMVVEGDDSTRDALTAKLVHEGFLVLPASNGRDAVNVLRTPLSPIDVMLLDTQLPDVKGIDLLQRLRELCPNLPAPVWMGDAKLRDTAPDQGMEYYLPKPIQMEQLVHTVRGLLGRRPWAGELS